MTAARSYQKIEASNVFRRNWDAYHDPGVKIIVNQGGTRSGKTYNIILMLIALCMQERLAVSVVSVSMPHLKKGAIRDFAEIMQAYGLWDDSAWNRTDKVYTFPNGSFIEFFSLDSPGKARGPGRDVLFVNEANLVDYETFNQLLWRTRKKAILDYNPADEYHWIYELVIPREDCRFIKSTYLDNPFLPAAQVKEIERLRDADETLWQVYGLGERGQSKETIYTHWKAAPWDAARINDWAYGLDFGFNVPTALVKVGFADDFITWKEVIYEQFLTNADLIQRLRDEIPPDERKRKKIYADAAEPQRIEEIRRAGFVVEPAIKDVEKGIDYVKANPLYITPDSVNLLKEVKSYKYKVDRKTEVVLDEPVKLNDHGMDAGRYAVATYLHRPVAKMAFSSTRPNRYGA